MMCFSPLVGRRQVDGGRPVFGPNAHSGALAQSVHAGAELKVRCGSCFGCRAKQAQDWAVRMMHESSFYDENYFLTLTYRDADLPADGGLDLADWQLFAKRVRESIGQFRFFHCGEYGEERGRPHYHAVVFGLRLDDLEHFKGRLSTSPKLEKLWGKGFVSIGGVEYDSCAYVSGYVHKKLSGKDGDDFYACRKTGLLRKRPYSTKSNRPGLGRKWIEKWHHEVYPRDSVLVNGRLVQPPRYYDDWMEARDPDLMESVKTTRQRKYSEMDLHKDRTVERMRVINRVKMLNKAHFKGDFGE